MSATSRAREERTLEELPFDFGAFLGSRLGLSQADAEACLGDWMRELDRTRHGDDRSGTSPEGRCASGHRPMAQRPAERR